MVNQALMTTSKLEQHCYGNNLRALSLLWAEDDRWLLDDPERACSSSLNHPIIPTIGPLGHLSRQLEIATSNVASIPFLDLTLFGIMMTNTGSFGGKSSSMLGIRASTNNRASTVLNLFEDIKASFGVPSRVHGDHAGTENLQ